MSIVRILGFKSPRITSSSMPPLYGKDKWTSFFIMWKAYGSVSHLSGFLQCLTLLSRIGVWICYRVQRNLADLMLLWRHMEQPIWMTPRHIRAGKITYTYFVRIWNIISIGYLTSLCFMYQQHPLSVCMTGTPLYSYFVAIHALALSSSHYRASPTPWLHLLLWLRAS